jgi:hypothetical protein
MAFEKWGRGGGAWADGVFEKGGTHSRTKKHGCKHTRGYHTCAGSKPKSSVEVEVEVELELELDVPPNSGGSMTSSTTPSLLTRSRRRRSEMACSREDLPYAVQEHEGGYVCWRNFIRV